MLPDNVTERKKTNQFFTPQISQDTSVKILNMPAVASVSGFKRNIYHGLFSFYHLTGMSAARHWIMNTKYSRHLITEQEASLTSHHTILGYDASQTSLETLFIFVTLCPKSSVSLSAEVAPASLLFGNSGHSKLNTILVSLLETILAEVRNLQSISKQSFHC